MSRAQIIALSVLSVVVVLVLALFLRGSESDSTEMASDSSAQVESSESVSQDEGAQPEASPSGVAAVGKNGAQGAAQVEVGKDKTKMSGTQAAPLVGTIPGTSAPGVSQPEAELAAKKASAPCQVAALKTDVKDIKGHLNEFRLARALGTKEPLCVFVDGKSVGHTRLKDGRVRIDWKIARSASSVSAKFCSDGVKCEVSCPEPEKDFWDTLGGNDELAAGTGFAEAETAEDKELQKEIKALKDVLKRKPAEALVATWTISDQKDSSCN